MAFISTSWLPAGPREYFVAFVDVELWGDVYDADIELECHALGYTGKEGLSAAIDDAYVELSGTLNHAEYASLGVASFGDTRDEDFDGVAIESGGEVFGRHEDVACECRADDICCAGADHVDGALNDARVFFANAVGVLILMDALDFTLMEEFG